MEQPSWRNKILICDREFCSPCRETPQQKQERSRIQRDRRKCNTSITLADSWKYMSTKFWDDRRQPATCVSVSELFGLCKFAQFAWYWKKAWRAPMLPVPKLNIPSLASDRRSTSEASFVHAIAHSLWKSLINSAAPQSHTVTAICCCTKSKIFPQT